VKDIYDTLHEWKKRRVSDGHSGSVFALATLIRVKGSSYRWPGARMLTARTEGESPRLTRESIQLWSVPTWQRF
jgi:xanthine/CO dehydrogenase XdhC/CoxF family maturation factor